MKHEEHRLGVSEVNLVVRHLKIEENSVDTVPAAVEEIDKVFGLDSVSFDKQTLVLNLAYDATRTCLDGIEELLSKHGVEVSHDWWTRFKEGYYRFVDENIQDNAKAEPWSCHKFTSGQPQRKRK